MIERFPHIYLASRSPRRAALLRQMGFPIQVVFGKVSEESVSTSSPVELVVELSKRKAQAVLDRVGDGLVVGADTIVFLEGEIIGKPHDKSEAKKTLMKLSGRTHQVFTGITLIQAVSYTHLTLPTN